MPTNTLPPIEPAQPVRLKPPADAEYVKQYNAGWRYSHSENPTLDHGDEINAPDAWYDGYLDYCVGREKWHYYYCAQHDNNPGGCGQA